MRVVVRIRPGKIGFDFQNQTKHATNKSKPIGNTNGLLDVLTQITE
jgi:hypothetical protein